MGKAAVFSLARALLLSCYDGVLSTLSTALPGYPFGSVVPFCLDRHGQPIILIADLAQHYKNVAADPRVSLLVFDRTADDLQAHARLTLMADASRVAPDDTDASDRYYRYFPESRGYHRTHGFEFWRLEVRRIRYIGGFGAIHWLEPADLALVNPFSAAEEAGMVAHMNEDHVAAMRDYLRAQLGAAVDSLQPAMAGADAAGIHLQVGQRVYWIPFATPVSRAGEVRGALVALAQRCRTSP